MWASSTARHARAPRARNSKRGTKNSAEDGERGLSAMRGVSPNAWWKEKLRPFGEGPGANHEHRDARLRKPVAYFRRRFELSSSALYASAVIEELEARLEQLRAQFGVPGMS